MVHTRDAYTAVFSELFSRFGLDRIFICMNCMVVQLMTPPCEISFSFLNRYYCRQPRFASLNFTKSSKVSKKVSKKNAPVREYLTFPEYLERHPDASRSKSSYENLIRKNDPKVWSQSNASTLPKKIPVPSPSMLVDSEFVSFDDYYKKQGLRLTKNKALQRYRALVQKKDSSILAAKPVIENLVMNDYFLEDVLVVPVPVHNKKPSSDCDEVKIEIYCNDSSSSPTKSSTIMPEIEKHDDFTSVKSTLKPTSFLFDDIDDIPITGDFDDDMSRLEKRNKHLPAPRPSYAVPKPISDELDALVEAPIITKERTGKDLAVVNKLKREARKARVAAKNSATRDYWQPADEYDHVKGRNKKSQRSRNRQDIRAGLHVDDLFAPLAVEEVKDIIKSNTTYAKKVRSRPNKSKVSEEDRKAREESNVLREIKLRRNAAKRNKIQKPIVEADVEGYTVPGFPILNKEEYVDEPEFTHADYEELLLPRTNYQNVMDQARRLFGHFSPTSSDGIDFFANLISFLYLAIKHRHDPLSVSAAMYLYGSSLDIPVTKKAGFAALVGTCSLLFVEGHVDTDSEIRSPVVEIGEVTAFCQGIFDMFIFTFDSVASKSIRDFVVGCAELGLFSKTASNRIRRNLGDHNTSHGKRMTTIGLVQICVSSLIKLIRISELIYNGMSLEEAVMTADPKSKAIGDAQLLIKMKDFTYAGLPVDAWMDRCTWLTMANSTLASLEAVIRVTAPVQPEYFSLSELHTSLLQAVAMVNNLNNSIQRQTPFAIILVGDPGIGKGQLAPFLFACHCEVKGRKYSPALVYARVKDSDYWDGYHPDSTPYVFYSELATVHLNRAKTAGDEGMDELTSVVDSNCKLANMSDVKDKGKVPIRPEFVLGDTNTEHLNLDGTVNNPAAFRRRFLYIRPIVKKEYLKEGSNQIDFKKTNDGKLHLDRWIFEVYYYASIDCRRTQKHTLMSGASTDDIHKLKDLVSGLMSQHILDQEALIKRANATDFTSYGTKPVVKIPDPPPRAPVTAMERVVALHKAHGDTHNQYDVMHKLLRPIKWKEYKQHIRGHIMKCSICSRNKSSPPPSKSDSEGDDPPDDDLTNFKKKIPFESKIRSAEDLLDVYKGMGNFRYIEDTVGENQTLLDHLSDSDDDKSLLEFVADSPNNGEDIKDPVPEIGLLDSFTIWDILKSLLPYLGKSIKEELMALCVKFFLFTGRFSRPGSVIPPYTTFGVSLLTTFVSFRFFPWYVGTIGLVANAGFWLSSALSNRLLRKQASTITDDINARLNVSRTNIRYALGLTNDSSTAYVALAAARDLLVLTAVLSVIKRIADLIIVVTKSDKIKRPSSEMHTIFPNRTPNTDKVQDLEEKTGATLPYARVDNKMAINPEWNVAIGIPPVYNGTLPGFVGLVYGNVRQAIITTVDNVDIKTKILGIQGSFALINRHALPKNFDDKKFKMNINVYPVGIEDPTVVFSSFLTNLDIAVVRDDVALINLSKCRFRDIHKHIFPDNVYPKIADGYIRDTPIKVCLHNHTYHVKSKSGFCAAKLSTPYQYELPQHKTGDCGSPLIVAKGNGYAVCGLHSIGSKDNTMCASSVFCLDDVRRAISILTGKSPFMILNSSKSRPESFIMPNSKSPFRHLTLHGLTYYGKLDAPILMNNKSHVKATPLQQTGVIDELFRVHCGFETKVAYGPPLMRPAKLKVDGEEVYVSPYNVNLSNINLQKQPLDRKVLRHCIDVFKSRIVSQLRAKGLDNLSPYLIREAVNGDPVDPFLRRIDVTKAAGYGWKGKKERYLPDSKEMGGYPIRYPNEELLNGIGLLIDDYSDDCSEGQVYAAQLKDEPRDYKKFLLGKTRLFMVSPVHGLVLNRMFLGPFYTLMVQHNDIFCTAIGTDMHTNASSVYDRLTRMSNNIMELDYKNYDQAMPFDIGWAASTLIYEVLESFGYNTFALSIVKGLLTDNLFPTVEILTDVFMVPGYQPSGKYATAEDNSLRGIFLLMYYWYVTPGLQRFDFFEWNSPVVYGDDLLNAVHDKFTKHMNNITYSKGCELHYMMQTTTASKDGSLTEFVAPGTMSFLKRTFSYDDRFGRIVAPLDLTSLHKTLSWYVESTSVTELEQMISAFNSVSRELMFHLEEAEHSAFRCAWISAMCDLTGHKIEHLSSLIPTYKTLLASLNGAANTLVSKEIRDEFEELVDSLDIESDIASNFEKVCKVPYDLSPSNSISIGREIDVSRPSYRLLHELENERDVLSSELKDDLESLRKEVENFRPSFNNCIVPSERHRKIVRYLSVVESIDFINRRSRIKNLRVESDVGMAHEGPVSDSNVVHVENVTDISGETPDMVSYGKSGPTSIMKDIDVSLDEFLSRPIEIDSFPLVGAGKSIRDIWALYLRNPTVRAKLKNYAFLRADLNVEVSLSATPFHYGRVFMAYSPWPNQNFSSSQMNDYSTETFVRYINGMKNVRRMNMSDNEPLHMVIPYISPQPMMRLFNRETTVLAATSDFEDAVDMGHLYIGMLDGVNCVNAGASAPVMYIYAWLSNYSLGCPTGTIMALSTESESRTGPVTYAINNLSKLADGLSKIPVINDYAHASSVALKSLGKFSANYGWSYPVNNNYASRMKNEPYQSSALTIGRDTAQHLTLTPDQGLTVDPHVVATSEDEMSIAAMTTREGFLSRFEWNPSTDPMTNMYNTLVSPGVMQSVSEGKIDTVVPTPLAFAATNFSFWRGDIIYRFDFVASKFHRGKVAILYEPNVSQNGLINSTLSLNKQYVMIVDIQETQTVEFCVKWARSRAWAPIERTYTADSLDHSDPDAFNGYLCVFPITNIQSPDNSGIPVYVSTRAETMMFNVREDFRMNDFVVESEFAPVTCEELNPTGASISHIAEDHFGEVPVSFRSLLKRFFMTNVVTTTQTPSYLAQLVHNFPIYPDFSYWNLFRNIRRAFLGMRGGMRIRHNIDGDYSIALGSTINVSLLETDTTEGSSIGYTTTIRSMKPNGTLQFVPHTNGGIEFHAPNYTNNLFGFAYRNDPDPYPNIPVVCPTACKRVQVEVPSYATSVRLNVMSATAEDFSFLYFIAPPVLVKP